jgi:hypothetical protein
MLSRRMIFAVEFAPEIGWAAKWRERFAGFFRVCLLLYRNYPLLSAQYTRCWQYAPLPII